MRSGRSHNPPAAGSRAPAHMGLDSLGHYRFLSQVRWACRATSVTPIAWQSRDSAACCTLRIIQSPASRKHRRRSEGLRGEFWITLLRCTQRIRGAKISQEALYHVRFWRRPKTRVDVVAKGRTWRSAFRWWMETKRLGWNHSPIGFMESLNWPGESAWPGRSLVRVSLGPW